MGSFAPAGNTSKFNDGTKKKVKIQGHEILIVRVGNKYYATDNRCPHLNSDLSRGKLEGTIITCNSTARQPKRLTIIHSFRKSLP